MANIIVVDDSIEIVDVIQNILEMEGHFVTGVTGKQAMMNEIINFPPDLIILDILLSKDNGRDICKALKANKATMHIPVLLMSASPKLLINPSDCGAEGVIAKPFHLNDLTEKVKSLLQLLILINLPEVSCSIIHHL